MSGRIVTLVAKGDPERIAKAKAAVIDCLEDVLAKAKKGELVSIAVAGVHGDGDMGGSSSTYTNTAGMQGNGLMGAVARLTHRLQAED